MKNQGISEYKMIDVGSKPETRRVCLATGVLSAKPSTIEAIRLGTLPKGNALPLAEAAGLIAVKKTSEILPLCHPLAIDSATLRFEFGEAQVHAFCEVSATAKTGVEMEALNGVSAALLCIYDLAKGIDPVLELSGIHLIEKRGGKSGVWTHPKVQESKPSPSLSQHPSAWENLTAAVITLSDRCAAGLQEDRSGPALVDFLKRKEIKDPKSFIISDDSEGLKRVILEIINSHSSDLILTTGGTGVGPRDITPETLAALAMESGGKLIPGIGEKIRRDGLMHTPFSTVSRAEGYLIRNALVIALPGSPKGAIESLESIEALIPHLIRVSRGAHHG